MTDIKTYISEITCLALKDSYRITWHDNNDDLVFVLSCPEMRAAHGVWKRDLESGLIDPNATYRHTLLYFQER